MINCPNCGVEQNEDDKFCSSCGKELTVATKEQKIDVPTGSEEPVEEVKAEPIVEAPAEETPKEVTPSKQEPEEHVVPQSGGVESDAVAADKAPPSVAEVEELVKHPISTGDNATSGKKKTNKKQVIIISIVAALVILGLAGFFGYKYIAGLPIDLVDDVKVTFKGYETVGMASFNQDKVKDEVKLAALKKAGISKKDAEALVKKDKDITKEYEKDPDLKQKVQEANKIAKKVQVKLSSTTNLSNGKKVTVSVTDKNNEDQQIVNADSRKVEIKGLKELEEVAIDDLLKDVKYSFTGFNGYGEFKIDDNPYDNITERLFSDITSDGSLSNDDSVELKINRKVATELLKEGKKLTGKDTTKAKVKGLKDPMAVGKLDECLKQLDEAAKKHYDGIKLEDLDIDGVDLEGMNASMSFNVEREASYLRLTESWLDKEMAFDIQSIYKIDVTMKANGVSQTQTYYEVHGYGNVPLKGEDLDYKKQYALITVFEDSLKEATSELTSSNLDYKKIEKK